MKLQWQLTLTYTLFTSAAVLLAVVISLYSFALYASQQFNDKHLAQTTLLNLRATIEQTNVVGLLNSPGQVQHLLEELTSFGFIELRYPLFGDLRVANRIGFELISVLNLNNEVIAMLASELASTSDRAHYSEARAIIQAAFSGKTSITELSLEKGNSLFITAPIQQMMGQVEAVVLIVLAKNSFQPDTPLSLLWGTVRNVPISLFFVIPFALGVGSVFGWFVSRFFVRNFRAFSSAADAWSQGNFAVRINKRGRDELSHLAGRLNTMASELQSLLETRQELASLEERNRLARDLHDSVKQQVFATAMQAATARELLDSSPDLAKQHLFEAESLAKQSQKELTQLIQELRPAALEGEGLVNALKAYLAQWSRRTGIAAELRVLNERPTTLGIELDLYRVVQEALANVAKHSQAKRVDVSLDWDEEVVHLLIKDDGQGFEPASVKTKGIGLSSMQERIEALGGQFSLQSKQGSSVSAKVPYKDYQDGREVRL